MAAVADLARHFGRSPERISVEEIRDFLHHLITERHVAYSTCNQKLAGIRFFYRAVLGQPDLALRVPAKRSGRLPEPLSRTEIGRLFANAVTTRQRVLLMTAYGGGLRVSELVRLQPADIYAEPLLIRVREGKGHKDRYTLLSPRLLEELRAYWRTYRPPVWLCPGGKAGQPLTVGTAQMMCRNRHCPKCQTQATAAWVAARQAELLPVPYFHLVFTLPHEPNGLILSSARNERVLLRLLFDAVAQTLLAFGRGELGGTISFTLVLRSATTG